MEKVTATLGEESIVESSRRPNTSGRCRQSDADSSNGTPNDQNYENKDMRNISVQTGEEFSPEFLRDRKNAFANDVSQIPTSKPGYDATQNRHLVYKDLTDFCPGKGYGFDPDHKTYLDGSSTYHRELQASAQHQRKLSDDFDKGSLSAISIYSSDSPNSNQPYSKGWGNLDRTFSGKIKFLCSSGGRILPRPNDAKLRYVGGDTRIISIRKDLTYDELVKRLLQFYQLPGEDLDALISMSSDEDLHHMIEEYHDLERKSQRLKLFLVAGGDLEGPSSSEAKSRQQSDADYQYVVAVNGMLDPNPHRSSSRESLESQWGNNLDGSSNIQKDSPTPFHYLENQKMLSGPSSRGFNATEIPSKPYIPSPVQFKDPKTFMKSYENVVCPYGYSNNCPYVVENPAYDNPGFVDAPVYYHNNNPIDTVPVIGSPVQSHATPMMGSHFRKPSKEFQSPLSYGPSYSDARRDFVNAMPLHAEKLVPSQDTFSFSPVSDVHDKSFRRVTNLLSESQPTNEERSFCLEQGTEKTYLPFAAENSPTVAMFCSSQGAHEKYQISRNMDQPYQEPPNLDKDYIEWGKDTINWKKNKEISFDQDRKNDATNNDFASNAKILEHKQNLPQIICHPNLKHSVHVPTSEPQVNGGKRSSSSYNSAENPTEVWKELPGSYQISLNEPGFLIKSQQETSGLKHDVPNAIDCTTTVFGCHGLQPAVGKENNNQSQLITPVLFSEDESSLGREVSGQKEMVKNSHGSVKKEKPDRDSQKELNIKNGTFVNSESSDKCHETRVRETPIIVEGVPCSSTAIPCIRDEYNDGVESPGEETETESVIYASEDEDVKADDDNKDESISDAAIIEMEASIYGLQIIKYADLEELQELGTGTFGTVYHGKWRGTDVAIKRIKNSCFAGGSSEQERLVHERFLEEAKILSRLHHPNVVAFYGVVPDGPGGTLATVTEYMANGSLRRVLLKKDRSVGGIVNNTLRPPIPERCDPEWRNLMEECWSHDPAARPSFTEITKRLQVMSTAPNRRNSVELKDDIPIPA
ncbi:hypothetical protein DH2020_043515 [Rehmannia glutinosa]|uniref:Protein kinase domain-containing protein n=1 Tax=Rehmannia glutinosa TaxID=99300 RepID=A0ABR0UJM1_REHGL